MPPKGADEGAVIEPFRLLQEGFALRGEFLSQRWESTQWPRPPSLAPSGQFTLRIAGGRLRMDTLCPYSPSLSPLAFGHLPLTRGVGPRSPITGDAYLLDFAAFPARKI